MIVIQKSNGYFNMGTNLKNIFHFLFPLIIHDFSIVT